MDKDHAEQYYYFRPSFYQSLREDLPDNNLVFWAESEGRVVAAAIMLFSNGRMNYHLSGSVQEYNHLAPTDLLIYEAALWGQKQGFRSLYLGGGVGSGEDSLFHFKRGFYKGNLRHFYIGRKIFDPVKYEQLLELRSTIDRPGFFPQYRG